jgi:ABC-type branched-subunit amino acid transport system substrate-binding protein
MNPPAPLTRLGIGAAFVLITMVATFSAGCSETSSERGDRTDAQNRPASTLRVSTPIEPPVSPQGSNGVSDDRVLFGQSAAFSGPAQELGTNMRLGIEAAFNEINTAGGVHGRVLELVTLDDAYEPEAAVNNTLRLIEEENVFALIGEVGTPTSRSATPVAADVGVPFIAPFTGAEFLRDHEWANIINLRASYYQETEEMVSRLIEDLGITRIGVLYQDDSYGRAGYRGVRIALDRRDMEPVSIGLYPRNTTAVKTALLDLNLGDPQAVIMIGAYEPVAAMVELARHTGIDPIFLTVSFVGSNALANELGAGGTGVYVTQVVPFPTDNSIPIVSSYLQALSSFDRFADPGFVSLEGYLAGRLAIEGLKRCGTEVDRGCFLDILDSSEEIDIDGFKLRFGDDNQGSDEVFITVIGDDGEYYPVSALSRNN